MPVFVWKERDKEYRLPFEGTPTVAELLREHGFSVHAPCGGMGKCGKCAVVLHGQVSPPHQAELLAGHRLSCRARLLGDAKGAPLREEAFAHVEGTEYTAEHSLGAVSAAVDVGTTTLALKVFASDGTPVGQATALNPNASYGADVMSRILASTQGHGQAMQASLIASIRHLLEQANGLDAANMVITGNTAMLYLLTGRPPHALATAPFLADRLFGEELPCEGKNIYLPPCMNAFVGADITCAVLASGMTDRDETALLCDVGTNGELALWQDGRLYVTSASAGPAFEGGELSCGCGYIPGAVCKAWTANGRLYTQTVENAPPVGICGSGLLDLLRCLLETGDMDESGAIHGDFVDVGGIRLTQKDIRKAQLAKAAMAAGIEMLLKRSGTAESDVSRVYLAGGFGTHLSPVSASAIGMIPRSFASKTVPLGNAALQGACMLLEGEAYREEDKKIASSATHVELGGSEDFNTAFVSHMNF